MASAKLSCIRSDKMSKKSINGRTICTLVRSKGYIFSVVCQVVHQHQRHFPNLINYTSMGNDQASIKRLDLIDYVTFRGEILEKDESHAKRVRLTFRLWHLKAFTHHQNMDYKFEARSVCWSTNAIKYLI